MKTLHKMAVARAASGVVNGARRVLGRPSKAVVSRRGIRWELDLHEGIDFAIYLFGVFEPSIVGKYRELVRPGDAVLDIGANIGAHTLPLALAVGAAGRVVAYEPTDFAFGKLKRNMALNPELEARIVPVQAFAADRAQEPPKQIYSSWPLGAREGLHDVHAGRAMSTAAARTVVIDDHLEGLGVRGIRLIKLDVDGHECGVLRGARRMLERDRPFILTELAPYTHREAGHSLDTCFDVLRDLGYTLRTFSGEHVPMSLLEAAARIPAGSSWNVLAAP